MTRRIVIFGATSSIAQALARRLVTGPARFVLVARDAARLNAVADDLRARGAAEVLVSVADLDDVARHAALVEDAAARLGGFDLVVDAHGVLGEPARYDVDGLEAARVLHTNLVSAVSLLTFAAGRVQAGGCVVGISSVAGDRGRGSNAVYGASKAGLTAFLSGLRARLSRSGVTVITVKPGPVDTPMTSHLPRTRAFASPDAVARDVARAVERRREVVYTPARWRLVMAVVRAIPERWFKRLRF